MTRHTLALAALFLPLAFGARAACAADDADLEAKLAAAQQRLEQAANEVAELSTQLGGTMMNRLMVTSDDLQRPVIGVQLDPASGADGARVLHVSPGGPAAAAGMRSGDVIVAVDATRMTGRAGVAREVTAALRAAPPEQPVKLKVLRDGKERELSVTPRPFTYGPMVIANPEAFTIATPAMPGVMPLPPTFMGRGVFQGAAGVMAGLEFVTLTPGLGEYFGADKGVLVVRAPREGALDLQEGDVIQSIGGREPKSGAYATRILASYQPGESVPIKVLRKKKAVTLNATLPE